MKTTEQLRTELDAKIPRDVISKREAGNGVKLDYLTGYYVIARLNEVFGQGNWDYQTEELTKVFEGQIEDRYGNPVNNVSYIAKISLNVKLKEPKKDNDEFYYGGTTTTFTDYGYGDGSDKKNAGKAHELAVKEAITDGVKRCAKNLGMSMGLALYDKEQTNVEEETNKSVGNSITTGTTTTPNGDYRKTIRSAVQVLNAQKKISVDEFKKKYTQGKGADQLTDDEIVTLYKRISTDYPELKLT